MASWRDDWTAEVAARLHHAGIPQKVLAQESGLSVPYLSNVLNRKQGDEKTRDVVLAALGRLEAQMQYQAELEDSNESES